MAKKVIKKHKKAAKKKPVRKPVVRKAKASKKETVNKIEKEYKDTVAEDEITGNMDSEPGDSDIDLTNDLGFDEVEEDFDFEEPEFESNQP